ncbi:diguanylate cyclase [Corallincola platygyrae]|uniref:Diguanylate cyclase n=1 Tax=Corallincola platygyrae TaxID=1193278 RepID=A0ABW4XKW2_9GAMM
MRKNKNPWLTTQSKAFAPYLWPLVLVILGVLSCISLYNYHAQRDRILEHRTQIMTQTALKGQLLLEKILQQKFQHIEDSIRLLAESDPLVQYAMARDPRSRHIVEHQWSLLAENSGLYTQIRFIDLEGHEQIRVNYSTRTKQASTAEQLQFKGHRSYMKLAKTTADHEVAVIAFDLEQEHGELIEPLTLAGRVLTPVVVGGERQGYVLFNLDMAEIMSLIDQQEQLNHFSIELTTHMGHYIRANDPNLNFGHVLSHRESKTLKVLQPGLWATTIDKSEGVVNRDHGVVSYRWIKLDSPTRVLNKETDHLLVITHINNDEILSATQEQMRSLEMAWQVRAALILLISILIGLVLQRWLAQFQLQKLMLSAVSRMSAVVLTDNKGKIVGVNRAFERLTGYQGNRLTGRKVDFFSAKDQPIEQVEQKIKESVQLYGQWQGEMQCLSLNGQTLSVWMEVSSVCRKNKNNVDFYVANFIDITERKKMEKELLRLSSTDPLTGISNRRRFDEELNRLTKIAGRYHEGGFCLAIADLDHFKAINDRYGHDVGDRVLQSFTKAVTPLLRETDMLARLGGEEFAILMPHTDLSAAITVSERLRQAIAHMMDEPQVTVSIGVTAYQHGMPETELYRRADTALYQAKTLGRNRVMSDDSPWTKVHSEADLSEELSG